MTDVAKSFKNDWIAKYGEWTGPTIVISPCYSCLITAIKQAGTLDTDKVSDVLANGLKFSSPIGDEQMISRPASEIIGPLIPLQYFTLNKLRTLKRPYWGPLELTKGTGINFNKVMASIGAKLREVVRLSGPPPYVGEKDPKLV